MLTPEQQDQIAIWRQKALEGTLTQDEMRQAITLLRQGRVSAGIKSDVARAKKVKQDIPNADDLLDELGGL
jgi:hypothetical protein